MKDNLPILLLIVGAGIGWYVLQRQASVNQATATTAGTIGPDPMAKYTGTMVDL